MLKLFKGFVNSQRPALDIDKVATGEVRAKAKRKAARKSTLSSPLQEQKPKKGAALLPGYFDFNANLHEHFEMHHL